VLKRSKAISVVFTGIITITAEVLLVLWTEGLIMASSAPSAGLKTSLDTARRSRERCHCDCWSQA
jgi:hypothetical protein